MIQLFSLALAAKMYKLVLEHITHFFLDDSMLVDKSQS